MIIHYQIYGLILQSDRELPLDRVPETSVTDYSLRFNHPTDMFALLRREFQRPWYVSPWRVKRGHAAIEGWKTEDSHKFLFRFCDGVEFIIDRSFKNIWADVRKASLQVGIHHFLFSLAGFLLGLRRSVSLHGATIELKNNAVALIGESGSGKSVLSANLAKQGIAVLSDDLVALSVAGDTIEVHPGYPWICLRPDSLQLLRPDYFDTRCLGSTWQYLEEEYIAWDLCGMGADSRLRPRKLEKIYLLSPVKCLVSKAVIERVPQRQALIALVEAASRTHIPYSEFILHEFLLLSALVASVPTYRLRYHVSQDSLTFLSDLLVRPSKIPQTTEKLQA